MNRPITFVTVTFGAALLILAAVLAQNPPKTPPVNPSLNPALVEEGRQQFLRTCAGCHGADGLGGERGPSIAHPDSDRLKSDESIATLVHTGIPDAGMPAFQFTPAETNAIVAYVRSLVTPAVLLHLPGDKAAGAAFFYGRGACSKCHMARGRGGFSGPDLTALGQRRTVTQIESALAKPGQPDSSHTDRPFQVATIRLKDGSSFRGFVRNRSTFDLELQEFNGRLHSLTRDDIAAVEEDPSSIMPPLQATPAEKRDLLAYLAALDADPFLGIPIAGEEAALRASFEQIVQPPPGDWPTYHGNLGGNRYSSLNRINRTNLNRLALKWTFPVHGAQDLEVTPVVVRGIMYVTTANRCVAVDARTGREIWHYERPLTKGVIGDAGANINRGVAVLGDRLFLVTDHAHVLSLHRLTGALLWDVAMADFKQHYGATSAPLVVNDLVISGSSGGDEGIRGFVAAFRVTTGEEVWRFWTAPKPGGPGSETWGGRAIEHPCVASWLTGTYDAETNLLFWPTGNPCPDYNGDERKGDNLYSDSVLALVPSTGKLAWYFQFTPHDLHDWDATETLLVADIDYHGERRKLLMQGNRNGFFYVLDRTNGKYLAAYPFAKMLNWTDGIDANGRPKPKPGMEPNAEGVNICPAVEGATNWMSSAFSPQTGLFYLQALEKCNIYTKSSAWWRQGESFYGGDTRDVPGLRPKKYLRAIDPQTGKIAWEIPQDGPGGTWGGLLATASGLVFFCEDGGGFAAADAANGELLWHFQVNQAWHASPMTYAVDGSQYVAIAAGSQILVFGLL
jgi:alcohol dehydrogenase (cytochrome c)